MGNVAVFLDRDGTVNEEVDFLTSPRDLHPIPRSAEAIRRANDLGLRVIIVTNQSGVARGLITEAELGDVHRALPGRLADHGPGSTASITVPTIPPRGPANTGGSATAGSRTPG